MRIPTAGAAVRAAGAFCLLALLSLWLTGCGKIKTAMQSLLHANRTTKSHPASHPARPSATNPRLAIILDDVGSDSGAVDGIFALHYALTLSVLPNHPRSAEIAREAHQRGYQVMLHLPMESLANETAELQELRPGMPPGEVASTLESMLRSVPYAAIS